MTTEHKIQMSSADQALRIMEADGEAAMCHFIASVARQPSPAPIHQPPRTAILDDGSMVHFVKNTYIFDTLPLHPHKAPETRPSSPYAQILPEAFQTPSPLFLWPNHLNLQNHILEHLTDLAEDYTGQDGSNPDAPHPLLIQQLVQEIHDAINNAVPSLEPTSANVADYLVNYMDNLACDIVDKMDPGVRQALIKHIETIYRHLDNGPEQHQLQKHSHR